MIINVTGAVDSYEPKVEWYTSIQCVQVKDAHHGNLWNGQRYRDVKIREYFSISVPFRKSGYSEWLRRYSAKKENLLYHFNFFLGCLNSYVTLLYKIELTNFQCNVSFIVNFVSS